jgi:hypothetical protein
VPLVHDIVDVGAATTHTMTVPDKRATALPSGPAGTVQRSSIACFTITGRETAGLPSIPAEGFPGYAPFR